MTRSGKKKITSNLPIDNGPTALKDPEDVNDNQLLIFIKEEMAKLSKSLDIKLQALESAIEGMREGQNSIVNSLSFLNEQFEELKVKTEKLEKTNKDLEKKNNNLERRLVEINGRLNDLDQYHRRINLEVVGVPEQREEDPEPGKDGQPRNHGP